MNRNVDRDVLVTADNLLYEIIKTQPQMFATAKLNSEGGKAAGEFITSLRNQLIEMYKTTPR